MYSILDKLGLKFLGVRWAVSCTYKTELSGRANTKIIILGVIIKWVVFETMKIGQDLKVTVEEEKILESGKWETERER